MEARLKQVSETIIEVRNKPLKCQSCPKSFDRRQQLENHVASSHNKSRGFQCPTCSRAFACHDNMADHSSRVHHILIRKPRPTRNTWVLKPCPRCGKDAKILGRHACYSTKKTYPCRCGKTYSRNDHLLRHLKKCNIRLDPDNPDNSDGAGANNDDEGSMDGN